jgi:hypothetical protein
MCHAEACVFFLYGASAGSGYNEDFDQKLAGSESKPRLR